MDNMSGASLPTGLVRNLESVLKAKTQKDVEVKIVKPGVFGGRSISTLRPSSPNHKIASATVIANTIIGINKQLGEHGIESFTGKDRQLINTLFTKLVGGDESLTKLLHASRETLLSSPQTSLAKEAMRAQNNLIIAAVTFNNPQAAAEHQLALPQAAKLNETAREWLSALEHSQNPNAPLVERALLTPSPSAAGTATGSYRLKVPTPGGGTKIIGIVKPANQGLAAPDNLDSAGKDYHINAWGFRPGQEVVGEHLTATMQTILDLPTNVPDTVTLPLTHTSFGSISDDLKTMHKEFQHAPSQKELLTALANHSDKEGFSAEIRDHVAKFAVDQMVLDLTSRNMHPAPGVDWNVEFKKILLESKGLEDAKAALIDLVGDEMTWQYCQGAAYALVVNKDQLNELLSKLHASISTAEPATNPSLCSVQAWVDGASDFHSATAQDLAKMSPISFARLAIIDGMVVGRDRNSGNWMLIDVGQQQLIDRLNTHEADMGKWLEDRLSMGTQGRLMGSAEENAKMIDDLAESLISDFEEESGVRIPNSNMRLEWDVHLLVHMYMNDLDTIKDVVPIDHGLTFPDPSIRSEHDGYNCLANPPNSSWLLQPSVSVGTIPRRTRQHLQSIDIRKEVLPALASEAQKLKLMAPADSGATIDFNESQQNLCFLSSRVVQIGNKLNATLLEMGVVKDGMRGVIDSPLDVLYEQFCEGKKSDQINITQLDRAIEAAYINARLALTAR